MTSDSLNLVESWLQDLGHIEYSQSFIDNGYDDMEICKYIGVADLDAIGVEIPEHKKCILDSVHELRQGLDNHSQKPFYFILENPHSPSILIKQQIEQCKKDTKTCSNSSSVASSLSFRSNGISSSTSGISVHIGYSSNENSVDFDEENLLNGNKSTHVMTKPLSGLNHHSSFDSNHSKSFNSSSCDMLDSEVTQSLSCDMKTKNSQNGKEKMDSVTNSVFSSLQSNNKSSTSSIEELSDNITRLDINEGDQQLEEHQQDKIQTCDSYNNMNKQNRIRSSSSYTNGYYGCPSSRNGSWRNSLSDTSSPCYMISAYGHANRSVPPPLPRCPPPSGSCTDMSDVDSLVSQPVHYNRYSMTSDYSCGNGQHHNNNSNLHSNHPSTDCTLPRHSPQQEIIRLHSTPSASTLTSSTHSTTAATAGLLSHALYSSGGRNNQPVDGNYDVKNYDVGGSNSNRASTLSLSSKTGSLRRMFSFRKSNKKHSYKPQMGDLNASEITMSDEDRIRLMVMVKEGSISLHEALATVKQYELERKNGVNKNLNDYIAGDCIRIPVSPDKSSKTTSPFRFLRGLSFRSSKRKKLLQDLEYYYREQEKRQKSVRDRMAALETVDENNTYSRPQCCSNKSCDASSPSFCTSKRCTSSSSNKNNTSRTSESSSALFTNQNSSNIAHNCDTHLYCYGSCSKDEAMDSVGLIPGSSFTRQIPNRQNSFNSSVSGHIGAAAATYSNSFQRSSSFRYSPAVYNSPSIITASAAARGSRCSECLHNNIGGGDEYGGVTGHPPRVESEEQNYFSRAYAGRHSYHGVPDTSAMRHSHSDVITFVHHVQASQAPPPLASSPVVCGGDSGSGSHNGSVTGDIYAGYHQHHQLQRHSICESPNHGHITLMPTPPTTTTTNLPTNCLHHIPTNSSCHLHQQRHNHTQQQQQPPPSEHHKQKSKQKKRGSGSVAIVTNAIAEEHSPCLSSSSSIDDIHHIGASSSMSVQASVHRGADTAANYDDDNNDDNINNNSPAMFRNLDNDNKDLVDDEESILVVSTTTQNECSSGEEKSSTRPNSSLSGCGVENGSRVNSQHSLSAAESDLPIEQYKPKKNFVSPSNTLNSNNKNDNRLLLSSSPLGTHSLSSRFQNRNNMMNRISKHHPGGSNVNGDLQENYAQTAVSVRNYGIPQSVEQLCRKLSLEHLLPIFLSNGFETLELFKQLDENDLTTLGVTDVTDRAKVLTAVTLLPDDEEGYDLPGYSYKSMKETGIYSKIGQDNNLIISNVGRSNNNNNITLHNIENNIDLKDKVGLIKDPNHNNNVSSTEHTFGGSVQVESPLLNSAVIQSSNTTRDSGCYMEQLNSSSQSQN